MTPEQRPILRTDILSVQSHVVYGHVGNNAALPVLQSAGLNVCPIPTVYYSNTPLYPSLYGGIIPADWFSGYLRAVEERGLLAHCRHILLGYLGSPEQAEILDRWLARIRVEYPHILIQIDPVLGDSHCGLYVDERLAAHYRDHLRHHAGGLTPNHFELEYLCQEKLDTLEATAAAARRLLSEQTRWVIVTSAAPNTWTDGEMQLLIVEKDRETLHRHPLYRSTAQGTGDTFAAGLAAALLQGENLENAVRAATRRTVATLIETAVEGNNELQLIKTLQKEPRI